MLELSNALEHLTGVLRPLARTFIDETLEADSEERIRAQNEAAGLARGMYRLTQLESTMATLLHRTRFNPTPVDSAPDSSSTAAPQPSQDGSEAAASPNQAQSSSTPNPQPRSRGSLFSSPNMTFSIYPDISVQFETSSGATIPISLPMTPTSNQPSRERNQDPASNTTAETQPSQQPSNAAEESTPSTPNALSSLLSSIFGGSPAGSLGSPFTTIYPSRSTGGSSAFIASTTIPIVSIIPATRIGQTRSSSNSENATNSNPAASNNDTGSTPQTDSNAPGVASSNSYDLGLFGSMLSNHLTLLEESQGRSNTSVADVFNLEPSSTNRAQDFVYQLLHSIHVSEAREIIRGNPTSLQQLHSRLSGYFQANISTERREEDIVNLSQSLGEYFVELLHLNEALPNNDTIIASLQDRLVRYLTKQCERLLRFLLDARPKRRANETSSFAAADFIPTWIREVVQEVRNDLFTAYGADRTREIVHMVVKHHLQSLCNLLSSSATRFLAELERMLLVNENSEATSSRDEESNPGESSNSAKRRKLSDS
ncbi:hypothetical protein K493DRAFT_108230 [Basidiobolus meristosporus CBS 931.73]|nr:hypothetical protein K493DRAFT_108230 [Basidiobolus meristosporus CBS 931.73]|eukprot:ORX76729.1 hypothetical protein K493DRAFT_108230 [Basidiobolus meristosporus CBS 931.73]